MPKLILIAAVAKNRVIGCNNQLIWQLPEDMAHFKSTTAGHTVLMGRKTWESLPPRFRPLPGRRNVVLSRRQNYEASDAELYASLQEALAHIDNEEIVFIIGGAEIYAQAILLADRLIITEIEDEPEGDALFPEISAEIWHEIARDRHVSADGLTYSFVSYQRKP